MLLELLPHTHNETLSIQTYILDGNLYDSKFLEGGTKASTENGTESLEDLESCALLLNKKKVRRAAGGWACQVRSMRGGTARTLDCSRRVQFTVQS